MTQYRHAAAKLTGLPGLVATFRGVRRRGPRWMTEPTLSCYVRRKIARSELGRDERIPRTLDGLATDVIAIGQPRLHAEVDSADRLVPAYDGSERTSALSALAPHPHGGMIALGSGHGLLPIQRGAYEAGRWRSGERPVTVFQDDAVEPGSLWFGQVGADADFAVVRFPRLAPPRALAGTLLAGAPIPIAPRRVARHDIVQHVAPRRGYRITGRIVGDSTLARPITLHAGDGIDVVYRDVIAVAGMDVRFSLAGESGSLVFDDRRRAIGFVVGGGHDPEDARLDISFVLRDFEAVQRGLADLFSGFFTRSAS